MNCPRCGYTLNPGKSCKGKVRYKSFKSANNALANQKASIKGQMGMFDGLKAYRCNYCGAYHLGHRPVKKRVVNG